MNEQIADIVVYIGLFAFIMLSTLCIVVWVSRKFEKLERRISQSEMAIRRLQPTSHEDTIGLVKNVNSLERRLKSIEENLQKQRTLIQQEHQPQTIQRDIRYLREDKLQAFCRFYNAVIEESNKRDEFLKRYEPIRIGVDNAMERRRNLSIEPDFQTSNNGDYYAVVIEGHTYFAVVPRFDLAFQDTTMVAGAMNFVFDCPNYDPQLRYRHVKVMKPAFFETDSAKQRWICKEKGELDLGQGERV